MQRYLGGLSAIALSAALTTPVALAAAQRKRVAHPHARRAAQAKRFSGRGPDYLNDAPRWTRESTGTFGFATSRNGTTLLNFRGTFYYYCGAGRGTVRAARIAITSKRTFDYRFYSPKKYGVDYGEVYGSFLKGGRRARIGYLVDFVANGQKVRHPYDVRHSRSLGCASWVQGIAVAR